MRNLVSSHIYKFILNKKILVVSFVCRIDANSSYNLEIWIIASNCRARWFSLNKVVDADQTNFSDLVDDVVDKYPGGFGDIVTVFYFCMESKVNIKLTLLIPCCLVLLLHCRSVHCSVRHLCVTACKNGSIS